MYFWSLSLLREKTAYKYPDELSASLNLLPAHYQALSATVRVSITDNVTINILKTNEGRSGKVYVKRLPEEWSTSPSYKIPLYLSSVRPSDTGIYIVHDDNNTKIREKFGAYYDVLVRGKAMFVHLFLFLLSVCSSVSYVFIYFRINI